MRFGHLLVSSSMLAGALFAIATLPLSTVRSQYVEVELQDKALFSGEIEQLAAPYLGLVTILSLGVGVTSLTLGGWRQSSRKLNQLEAARRQLQKEIQEKTAAIEQLTFSSRQLQQVGLSMFIDHEPTVDANEKMTDAAPAISAGATQAVNFLPQLPTHTPVDSTEDSTHLQQLLQDLKQITAQIEGINQGQSPQPAVTNRGSSNGHANGSNAKYHVITSG